MTIFTAHTCEIPHCTNETEQNQNGTHKKRCKRCAEHYDAQGVAFVLYCDFHHFTNHGRGRITFWVHDDYVQLAPQPFAHLVGTHVDHLYDVMEDCDCHFLEITPAQLHDS